MKYKKFVFYIALKKLSFVPPFCKTLNNNLKAKSHSWAVFIYRITLMQWETMRWFTTWDTLWLRCDGRTVQFTEDLL